MKSSSTTFRVEAQAMRRHYTHMRGVAVATLASCGPSAVAAIVVALVLHWADSGPVTRVCVGLLGAATPVLLVGIIVGLDVLRRARRGLSREGDLVVSFFGTLCTAQRGQAEPHVLAQPLIGGQAFADHVQLTAGVIPKPLFQIELPLIGEERAAFLAALRAIGVHAPIRPSFAMNLARILALAGPLIVALVLVLKLIQLLIVAALIRGLAALPVYLGAFVLVMSSITAMFYIAVRVHRFSRLRRVRREEA